MNRVPSMRLTTITVDCSDGETLAAFYSGLLGWEIADRDGAGWFQLRDPASGVGLNVQADDSYQPPTWPEQAGRQGKMMHFEVLVNDLDAAVTRVVQLGGAEAAYQPPNRNQARLRVMLDPAGHPLCLFVRGE